MRRWRRTINCENSQRVSTADQCWYGSSLSKGIGPDSKHTVRYHLCGFANILFSITQQHTYFDPFEWFDLTTLGVHQTTPSQVIHPAALIFDHVSTTGRFQPLSSSVGCLTPRKGTSIRTRWTVRTSGLPALLEMDLAIYERTYMATIFQESTATNPVSTTPAIRSFFMAR